MMDTNWLTDLAKNSLGNFEVTRERDLDLSALAFQAKHDADAGWRLLGLLSWKIARFVRRFRTWDLDPFEIDDVVQQAYLVFHDTIRCWLPRSATRPPSGYLHYFLEVFPYWLASAVRRWRRPTRPAVIRRRTASPPHVMDSAIVEEFCRALGPEESRLLKLRLLNGLTVPHAARTMGLARRTAYRRWNRVLEVGRDYLRETG